MPAEAKTITPKPGESWKHTRTRRTARIVAVSTTLPGHPFLAVEYVYTSLSVRRLHGASRPKTKIASIQRFLRDWTQSP